MDNTTTKARDISRPVHAYIVPILQDVTTDHKHSVVKGINK